MKKGLRTGLVSGLIVMAALFMYSIIVSAHNTELNIKTDYAAVGNGTTDDAAAIQNAITHLGTEGGGTIFFPVGTYKISSDITFPANSTIRFANGAKLSPDTGVTITVSGSIDAKLHQIFAGAGSVKGADERKLTVIPQWWGAKGDGATDSTAAFQYVFTNFRSIHIPIGRYLITDTITIAKIAGSDSGGIVVTGSGKDNTTILFNPASAKVLFKVHDINTGGAFYKGTFSDFRIMGQGTFQKTAFQLNDVSEFNMDNIQIIAFTGNKSVGLQLRGREANTFSRITIGADIPISIEKNGTMGIDNDHSHFLDTYLINTDFDEPCIKVAAGVYLSNLTFDGRQAWALGKYGFYWDDAGGALQSHNIVFKNVRFEQPSVSGGYIFYINASYGIQSLTFDNVRGGGAAGPHFDIKGFYLRKVKNVAINNSIYAGQLEAINADSTVEKLTLHNTLIQQGATVTLTGMSQVWADPLYIWAMPVNAEYQSDTVHPYNYFTLTSINSSGWASTIADGATKAIPFDYIHQSGTIIISSDTGEGAMYAVSSAGPVTIAKISGSADTVAGDVANKLCVVWVNSQSIMVKNNTGASINVNVIMFWN